MTMLIRGGLLYTMTGQGCCTGDILIRGSQIEAVAPHIDPPEDAACCLLDAAGMTILPGLIDACIRDGPETDTNLLASPQATGVTAGLLWPEQEGRCSILTADGAGISQVYVIQPDGYTDAQLHDRFLALAEDGLRPACEVTGALMCRRVLQTVHSTRVKAILSLSCDCETMLEAIALSGCQVVIGSSGAQGGSPWAAALRLEELGVPFALSCRYPAARPCRLPLCAALCTRGGMTGECALHAVTAAPARLLGLSDAGRIAAGFRADLAIYNGDPLLLATCHVMTICNGKIRH